jgi:NADPH:quinone reductase-like Zn-dependent oxidoreductase
MKVHEIRDGFGLDRLVEGERPEPEAGPGQVLLRMRAASLNYRDLLTVQGQYNPKQPLPLVPCSDGVGEVVAVGPGVERIGVGDRVTPIFAQRWLAGEPTKKALSSTLGGPIDGTLAEGMAVDAESVVAAPEHLTDEEAATLPCAAVTAWSALVSLGGVKAGDTVLLQGTGGVSIFALQFARLLGARVILTSSSDEKLERARSLGAAETLNYRTVPEWGREAKRLCGGVGADLVVEVGGARTLPQSLAAIRPGGTLALIGVLSGRTAELNLAAILMQQVRVQGVFVGSRERFEAMNRAIELHRLRPAVDKVFPWEQTRAAFEHLASGEHFGKICVRTG